MNISRLPISCIKVDRSFVRGIGYSRSCEVIIDAVIGIAHNLEKHVVAEGVESAAHIDYLRNRGCHIAQGFYISKPLSAEDFEVFSANRDALRSKTSADVVSIV